MLADTCKVPYEYLWLDLVVKAAVLIVSTKKSMMIDNGAPQLVSTPPLAGIEHSGNPAERGKVEAKITRGTDRRKKGKREGDFVPTVFRLVISRSRRHSIYHIGTSYLVYNMSFQSRRTYCT